MRRQYFAWTWLTLAIVLTGYGSYSIIYYRANNKAVPVLGWVFFITGTVLLVVYLILFFISLFQKKKITKAKENNVIVEAEEEAVPQEEKNEAIQEVKETPLRPVNQSRKSDVTYECRSRGSGFSGGSGYVKMIGYGPILRINEEQILDMRSNTYYRIEGNMVNQQGCGPVYEISGNRIRLAFGSYLYEISGDNVNKIFGGYYASISGGTLQTFDLKEKYEIPSDLNLKQKLAIVALLFGTY